MKKKRILVYIAFMFIMIALGASDSMRGIFSGIFESHFYLNKSQVSFIVTVSYIGNLVFILLGSRMADKYDKKKVCIGIMLLWALALLIYIFTDNYYCLLVGMFVSMGTSTLMNTMINILSPTFFGAGAGMIVNTLFFTQGIGTSGNQSITGRFATGYGSFRLVNIILLVLGTLGVAILMLVKFPKDERENTGETTENDTIKKKVTKTIVTNKAFIIFVLIFGFYFIAEHGVMNWWLMYCNESLGLDKAASATYLSLFWGGMTVGRLLLSPFVLKLGVGKSIRIFGGIGTVLYVAGVFFGAPTLFMVSLSGLFISIIYPTLVLMINDYFEYDIIASATGYIISAATVFDIAFNAVFGKIIDTVGFSKSIMIFPVSMAVFYILFMVLSGMNKEKSN